MKLILIGDDRGSITAFLNSNKIEGMVILNSQDLNGTVPEEIQLIPFGEMNTPKYGKLIVNDNSIKSIMDDAATHKNDMVIDYEHQTFSNPPIAAPAAGWIKKLINKGKDGIWGVVEWTAKARELIANKEYRYFSPVTITLKGSKVVMALMGGGLTNIPNIDGMVPLTNRAGTTGTQKEDARMNRIAAMLGLPETATEEEILAAIQKMKDAMGSAVQENKTAVEIHKATVTALGLKPQASVSEITGTLTAMVQAHKNTGDLATTVSDLRSRIEARESQDVEALVNSAIAGDEKGSKLMPSQREWALGLAKKDLAAFKVFLNTAAYVVVKGKVVGDPPAGGSTGIDETQLQINKMLGISDNTFKKHNPVAA